ncbi:ATP synthase subunit I [Clostridium senegalense]|uniref:ATP synthase subunit I n=1 Tax=Clostridium senegalense TaxID=1465809 RepID=UPI0002896670|nr:ATP synthase subunit I [Clostridium senegalense]MBU5227435.1 ATP synthase subunit I [Clostridium senegalense]
MHKENKLLLKSIFKYDLLLLITVTIIGYFIIGERILFFTSGLSIAFINLVINTVSLNKFLSEDNNNLQSVLMISKLIRVIIVVIISILIIRNTTSGFILFIVGYSLQFISFILYGNKYKNK